MDQYRIEGSRPIAGTIRASGNKNAALPCIAAAILADGPVILRNVPDIEDVNVMIDVYRRSGRVKRLAPNEYRLRSRIFRVPMCQ
jgi:UDP-N-acetylglucosamine 1-carboxyvinyltransferase